MAKTILPIEQRSPFSYIAGQPFEIEVKQVEIVPDDGPHIIEIRPASDLKYTIAGTASEVEVWQLQALQHGRHCASGMLKPQECT